MARRRTNNAGSRRAGTMTQTVSRGGIQKRSPAPPRVDKDGDLDMDAPEGHSRGRGRGKDRATNRRGADRAVRRGKPPGIPAGNRGDTLEKALIRGMNSGEAIVRDNCEARPSNKQKRYVEPTWDQISVRGWTESKAASNPGGGIKQLLEFLQRKASSSTVPVNIMQSHTEGDNLIIAVKKEDTASIVRLNTYSFAGAPITVKKLETPLPAKDEEVKDTTTILKEKFATMLERRYNPTTKLLDLTTLGKDPEFATSGIFQEHSTESKFFPALMRICDDKWPSRQLKSELVLGITLARNDLPSVVPITTLAQTFPDLKNLDLSNNKISTLKDLEPWRHRFKSLTWLVLGGNPIEKEVPAYHEEIVQWYPTLLTLNDSEVPRVPVGYAVAVPGKTEEQLQMEVLTLQLTQETGLTLKFSKLCLEAATWNMEGARQAFETNKASLTPEMFLKR